MKNRIWVSLIEIKEFVVFVKSNVKYLVSIWINNTNTQIPYSPEYRKNEWTIERMYELGKR
jgi:hypothetical protein